MSESTDLKTQGENIKMDNNNMMPELTLTPFADKPVEKPAEPEVPAAQDAD